MRKRWPIVLAAGGRWPDADDNVGEPFNWVKIDNRGANDVDVSLGSNPIAGNLEQTLLTVSSGKVRVFNVAGPKQQDGTRGGDWPDEIFLVSASGTTLMLEVADHPIVDLPNPGIGQSLLDAANVDSVYGTATAPQAGANIATSAALATGTWRVTINAWYGATADAADNMKLVWQSGIGTYSQVQLEVPPAADGPSVPQTVVVTVAGVPSPVWVQNIAAGAAGSVYKARLDIEKLA